MHSNSTFIYYSSYFYDRPESNRNFYQIKSKYACYSKTNTRATRAKQKRVLPEENKYACFRVHNTLKQYEQAGYPQPKNPQGLFERLSKLLSAFLTSLL